MSNPNPLLKIVAYLTPPPPVVPEDYDGLEFRWKIFTFRPAMFQYELYLIAAVLSYLLLYYTGKNSNASRASKWLEAHSKIYASQFSKPIQPDGPTRDGNSDSFAFSTGRRAVTSLHTVFSFIPRHDPFQLIYQFVWGLIELTYRAGDEVELDFTLNDSANIPDCVWAVVSKNELRTIKNKRWDLTFTKVTENPNLPPLLTVMSEFADVTETLFKPHGPLSLTTVLSNPAILPYFRSLSITDQPRARPLVPLDPSQRSKHLILSLYVPKSDPSVTLPLVQAVFQLIDVITAEGGWGVGKGPTTGKGGIGLNPSLRPETRTKLKKAREDVDKELKEDSVKEKREEAIEEKAAAKKKAEEERLAKLSAADQKKALEREKKRAIRKSQGKIKQR